MTEDETFTTGELASSAPDLDTATMSEDETFTAGDLAAGAPVVPTTDFNLAVPFATADIATGIALQLEHRPLTKRKHLSLTN